jgi:hypothetical protein
MKRVVLFSGEISSGTMSHTDASINDEGDLVIATQDVGAAPRLAFGDSDYEWWIVVRAGHTSRVLDLLQHDAGVTDDDREIQLLTLLERKFGGRISSPDDLQKWLDNNGIPYEFSSFS